MLGWQIGPWERQANKVEKVSFHFGASLRKCLLSSFVCLPTSTPPPSPLSHPHSLLPSPLYIKSCLSLLAVFSNLSRLYFLLLCEISRSHCVISSLYPWIQNIKSIPLPPSLLSLPRSPPPLYLSHSHPLSRTHPLTVCFSDGLSFSYSFSLSLAPLTHSLSAMSSRGKSKNGEWTETQAAK